MKSHLLLPLAALVLAAAAPARAQQFTTAAEVRPILDATRASWVALNGNDGRDLLYFTQVLSWRCGLETIAFSVNGGDLLALETEPCYRDTNAPNALKIDRILPFLEYPVNSIQTVRVLLVFGDGSRDEQTYQRKDVLMP